MFKRDNRDRGFGGRGGKSFGGGRGGFGKKGGFGGGRDGGRPQMFKAVCSDCGSPCEVPFRPSAGKPVLCNDCFRNGGKSNKGFDRDRGFNDRGGYNDRGFERRDRDDRGDRGDRQMYDATCDECGDACKVPFKPNGDKPVLCDYCFKYAKNERASKDDAPISMKKTAPNKGGDSYKEQFEMLNIKLDRILKALDAEAAEKYASGEFTTTEMNEDDDMENEGGIDPFEEPILIGGDKKTAEEPKEKAPKKAKSAAPKKKKAKKE